MNIQETTWAESHQDEDEQKSPREEWRRFYQENGYLIVPECISKEEVAELCDETVRICRGTRGALHEKGAQASQALDLDSMSDEEVLKHFLCVHNCHKSSEKMLEMVRHPAVVRVLTSLIGRNVKCMQSMLFIKAAGKPGQAWHQDEDYIPTRDRSLCGAWMAMDDATVDNGCLWVIPGSHQSGILWPQYPHQKKEYDCSHESYGYPYSDSDAVPVEVKRGTVVFFNGYLLHRSLPNRRTSGFRRCLVNHYMSAESLLPWHQRPGVSNAKNDFRDIVMVAGTDPHAWKGIENHHEPHVRKAGEGGCGDGRIPLEEFMKRSAQERAKL